MLTQPIPNGDWIELESIIHVAATEMAPGEWAVIGHTPGGHWINLEEPTVPDGVRGQGRLLKKEDAERLRDQWAAGVNKAKADAIKAEATERLAVLQRWRSDQRTKERASEASTWQAAKVYAYRLNVETGESTLVNADDQTKDNVPPPNCPTCQAPLMSVASRSDGMRFGGCDKCNSTYFFKGSVFYSRDSATAEFTPVDPQPSWSPYSRDKITVEVSNEPPYASIGLRLEPTGLGSSEVSPPKVTTVAETKAETVAEPDEEVGETWRDRKPLA